MLRLLIISVFIIFLVSLFSLDLFVWRMETS